MGPVVQSATSPVDHSLEKARLRMASSPMRPARRASVGCTPRGQTQVAHMDARQLIPVAVQAAVHGV